MGLAILVYFWGTYSLETFMIADDNLFWEKMMFVIFLTLHGMDWTRNQNGQSRHYKTFAVVVLGALGLTALGILKTKPSLIATGFVAFMSGWLFLVKDRKNDTFPWILLGALACLTLPRWLVLFPVYGYLQTWATHASAWLIALFYDGVEAQNFVIWSPPIFVNITQACDGSSPMLLSVATAIWSCIGVTSWRSIGLRITLTVVWSILINWVRILAITAMAHQGDVDFAFNEWHDGLGHVAFALCLMPLVWYSSLPDIWNRWIDEAIDWLKAIREAKARP